jgi:serine protease
VRRGLVALVALLLSVPDLGIAAGDPLRSQQWGWQIIHAQAAWKKARGGGVRVAVVDTGIDLEHPDLVDRLLPGRDFVDTDSPPQDRHGHGTLVAGIIGATADNSIGIAGVAPEVRLIPVRALGADGRGDAGAVADAIDWSVQAGAEVINLSLVDEGQGTTGIGGVFGDHRVANAISRAAEAGAVVVIAAGNDEQGGHAETAYDATDPRVIVVGASTRADKRAAYSNYGEGLDVLAPGGGSADDPGESGCTVNNGIVSTWWSPGASGPRYGASCGTSMATAFVSGIAAMLVDRGLLAEEVVQRIKETAVDLPPKGPDAQSGVGRVDAARALRVKLSSPSPTPKPTKPSAPVVPVRPIQPSVQPTEPPFEQPTKTPSKPPSERPAVPVEGPEEVPTAAPVPASVGVARLLAGLLIALAGVANIRVRASQRSKWMI